MGSGEARTENVECSAESPWGRRASWAWTAALNARAGQQWTASQLDEASVRGTRHPVFTPPAVPVLVRVRRRRRFDFLW